MRYALSRGIIIQIRWFSAMTSDNIHHIKKIDSSEVASHFGAESHGADQSHNQLLEVAVTKPSLNAEPLTV
jgi:hypothetical protein